MKKALIIVLSLSTATPALAQHTGHAMPDSAAEGKASDPHAGHEMPAADPHAGHDLPAAPPAATQKQPDPHAGHTPPASAPAEADPHANHAAAAQSPTPPVGPPPPAALAGPAHAADTVFAPLVMADARQEVRAEHGGLKAYKFTIDQLEVAARKGRDGYAWEDVQFWYGGDLNKLWLKSEGEGTFGDGIESAEVQALWSRAIAPFFDLQAGLRYDIRPKPDRAYLALGLQGLAPYWFEVDAATFLSDKGDLTARLEGEYDLRVTQQLILQPRAEVELAAQDVPELGIGSGLSTAEAGLRLRYEFVPEFAPYVGVEYEHAFGNTADLRRAEGEDAGGWNLVLGVRAWF
jgi:copper resistance protein B